MQLARIEWLFLAVIAAVTIGLRIPTVTYGLPTFEGADDVFVLQPALEIASLIKPATQFGLPDSTLFYGYGAVFRVVFETLDAFGRTSGAHPLDDYLTHHATWPLITVRIINIATTLATFFLLYLCARKLFSKSAAMMSVLLASTSWILLEHTIHARPDLLSGALALAVLYASLRIIEQPTMRNYLVAGVLVGLSIATKYPLALTALIVIAAHGAHCEWKARAILQSKQLWLAGGVALITFSIATPLFWPLLPRAIEQLRYEARTSHLGADGLSFWGNLRFYATHVLNYGIGTLTSILALVGALHLLVKRRSQALTVLVFPIALIIALSLHGLHWDRWMIPVVPFIALLAGYVITEITCLPRLQNRWCRQFAGRAGMAPPKAESEAETLAPRPRRGRGRVSASACFWKVGLVAVISLTLVPPAMRTIRTWNSFRHAETREVAKNWLIENGIPNARVAREPYTPFLNNAMNETLLPSLGVLNDKQLTERNMDYLLANADQRERLFTAPDTFPVFIEYYENNLRASQLVFTARVAPERNVERLTETPDWNIWNNLPTLDAERGSNIEIHAFSEAAKQRHTN